jgi:hypothetical protein
LERLKRECTKIQPKGAIFFTKLRKVIRIKDMGEDFKGLEMDS